MSARTNRGSSLLRNCFMGRKSWSDGVMEWWKYCGINSVGGNDGDKSGGPEREFVPQYFVRLLTRFPEDSFYPCRFYMPHLTAHHCNSTAGKNWNHYRNSSSTSPDICKSDRNFSPLASVLGNKCVLPLHCLKMPDA